MKSRVLPIMAFMVLILLVTAEMAVAGRDSGTDGLVSLSGLRGEDVRGPGGTLLGAVEDVAIAPGGAPSFLVLSQGSAFGRVGPFRLIPWQIAAPRIGKKKVVIPFDQKTIEEAPGIDMEKWPPGALPSGYLQQVFAYYQKIMEEKANPRLP